MFKIFQIFKCGVVRQPFCNFVSNNPEKHLSTIQLQNRPTKLHDTFIDSSYGRDQVTFIFGGCEMKGRDHSKIKWPCLQPSSKSLAPNFQLTITFRGKEAKSHGKSMIILGEVWSNIMQIRL